MTHYDTYFKGQSIDPCKIDFEGAEYEVFDSSADSLLQNIRYLLKEFHGEDRCAGPQNAIAWIYGDFSRGRSQYRAKHRSSRVPRKKRIRNLLKLATM
jgi:hypothetical protein